MVASLLRTRRPKEVLRDPNGHRGAGRFSWRNETAQVCGIPCASQGDQGHHLDRTGTRDAGRKAFRGDETRSMLLHAGKPFRRSAPENSCILTASLMSERMPPGRHGSKYRVYASSWVSRNLEFQGIKPAYSNTRGSREYSGPQCSFARHDLRSYRHPSWTDRRHSDNLRCVIFISPRAPYGLRPRSCQGGIRRAAAVSSRADERTRTADLIPLRVGAVMGSA